MWLPFKRVQSVQTTPVEDFLAEAEGIADFGFQTGLITDASLVTAIEAARKLPAGQQTFDKKEMIDLYQKVAAIKTDIPPSTVAAIRQGWGPNKDKAHETFTNIVFVVLAIFVTLAVGHLTLIHSRGTALVADLSRLEESNPGLQFGILERRLLRAQEVVFSSSDSVTAPIVAPGAVDIAGSEQEKTGSKSSNEEALAQDSVLRDAYDLSVLNQRLLSARSRTNEFMLQAYQPYPRLAAVYSGLLFAVDSLRSAAGLLWCSTFTTPVETCSGQPAPLAKDYQTGYASNYASLDEKSLPVFCGYIDNIKKYQMDLRRAPVRSTNI